MTRRGRTLARRDQQSGGHDQNGWQNSAVKAWGSKVQRHYDASSRMAGQSGVSFEVVLPHWPKLGSGFGAVPLRRVRGGTHSGLKTGETNPRVIPNLEELSDLCV